MEITKEINVFNVWKHEDCFTIHVPIESKNIFYLYTPLFEKYEYEGNGYFWEGLIIQVLEELDRELLKSLEFDPEAGGFYAYSHSEKAVNRFINLLEPIFSDLYQLEGFVQTADRNRINF